MGGKKKKQQQNRPPKNSRDLFKSVREFTSKEEWDLFFAMTGSGDSFEWYADWPQLQSLLTKQLLSPPSLLPKTAGEAPVALEAGLLVILVPGCGNSKLSEHLYDDGFTGIINLDFSKVVIHEMRKRNLTERPEMVWHVMDITDMQFDSKTMDVIIDKAGLDTLMVDELRATEGSLYLADVKRILEAGGKYICFTLGESHVSDLLFSMFRFGWKMSLYTVPKEPSSKLQTFMVVVEKDICASVSMISSYMDEYSVGSHGNQARQFYEAVEKEQKVRLEYSSGSDTLYSLKDVGKNGNPHVLVEGRRIKLILGEPKGSTFYKGILIDAQKDSGPFKAPMAVLIVPYIRVDDWLFSSEEGQNLILAKSQACRLLIILLDSMNFWSSMEILKIELDHSLKQLIPNLSQNEVEIPFLTVNDRIWRKFNVKQVKSTVTGPIVVDEVIYSNLDKYNKDLDFLSESKDLDCESEHKELVFRRLTFERSPGVVQSEALLSSEETDPTAEPLTEENEVQKASKPRKVKKKGKQKRSYFRPSRKADDADGAASRNERKVDHNYLALPYQNAIISGLMLISLHLKESSSTRGMVETVVIGLGGGLLPMFMKNWIPNLNIEVVELDQVVLDVAKEHFGFKEDENLRVRVTDGIQFVRDKADSGAEGESTSKLDILIVDVDAPNIRSALACPAADFVEESFFQNAKNCLSKEGLFVIYLGSKSSTAKVPIYSSLKKVFGKSLVSLELEEYFNEVIFALKNESPITEEDLSKACDKLERSLELVNQHRWTKKVIKASKLIRPLI
ncbi:hypothetical protein MIMGU_mgv1a001585mg [Erythranthe guttata]|uniref:Methyltransferase domain-containing protein n=1 Tax=Erythranthe guttata TaxID=4155 RepID=A0A022PX01_ERYGU|nr:PREDICTED: methyltransferase-like protein 13 [Erythranthe guttata]EYU18775.1 hypothetical protein MIMGU_mgv1a001585mg [Erythranthe guttata]|eukprot:XP_012827987.1 PREDICTED: methyltransferase-like protein 13 [Erythranthe guttata]